MKGNSKLYKRKKMCDESERKTLLLRGNLYF